MTGTGIGFDFSQLMTQFSTLDSQLRSLTVQGEAFGKSMRDMIKGLSNSGGLEDFIKQLTNLRYQIVGHKATKKGEEDIFGFGKQKMLMNWDSTSLQNYINEVNKLILVIKAVQNEGKGAGISTNGLQITGLRKEVKEAQELLAIIKKIEQQQKRSSYDRNTSYSGAVKYSDNVNSLEQERQAIVNLEAAKAKLKKSDADYDIKLNELNTRIQQHTENVRRASQTSAQAADEQRRNAEKIARINATTYAGAISSSNNATTLEQERQAVQNLEAARNKLSKTDSDYQTKLDELNKRIQQHNENIRKSAMTSEQVAEEERKNAEKIAKAKADAFKTPAELISMNGSANSLNELRKYAEHLQRTMATLNPKSNEWSKLNTILQQTNGKISNIENRMRSFTNESRRATSAAGGLATMIASVFSAQQIFQYVKQLVNVTGEFEQMHIALNVITGDLEASNRIWEQTMELAKKSPFQARELVKYTRQLAAYRIETSRLHDTTKMLADVSAGLGVDMSRLILAYGQVRAAEYLRGTELRQFTEAGVPMLDELAKHFTELEGKAISTAEVFDMISKRKVAFEDVSAVLEKMTGSGGPFYRMQEQMSNTIKGSISNLKDEVDLMMYEIGTSSSGTIKGFLELLRSLVRNWEKIAAILKVVTALYIGYNIAAIAAATSTHGFGAALTGATIKSGLLAGAVGALTRAIVRMSTAFLATPFGLITLALSAIAGGIWAIVGASRSAEEQEKRRAEELKQELDSINKKYEEAKNLISGITDVFNDENSSITDASVALHKLVDLANKEYNLIFNVDVKGKTEEQIIEEGEKIATEMLAIEEDSKMLQTAWEEAWSVSEVYFKKFYNGYKQVGEIAQTVGEEEFVTPILEKAILEDNKTYKSNIQDAQAKITQYYDGIKEKIKKEFTKLENQAALKMSPMAILEMYFKKKTDSGVSLDETETTVLHAISTIRYEYEKVAEEIIGATYVADNTDASISKFFSDMIEGNEFTAEQAKELQTVIEGKLGKELHVAEGSLTDWQERFNSFLSKIEDANLKGIDTEAIANLGDKYKKLIEVDGKQVRSNDLARFFEAITPGQEITEEELKKKVKEELDYWKSIKEAYENALAKGIESIHTEGDYEIAKLAVKFLDPLNTYVGNINKGGKGKNKAEEANKRRIDLLKKMNSQYLSEFKTFGDEAEPEIRAAYEKAFGEVFKGTKIELEGIDFTSKTGMVEALEKLRPHAKKAGKDAVDALETEIAKFKGEIKLEARKDLFQETLDDIDELFDKYELSLEIKKLNIPPDLAKSLFGEEYLTLDELKVKTKQEFVGDVADADKAKKLTDELNKGLANIDWNIVEGILGTDQMKELKKTLEKIDDIEDKAAKERMKTYSKYLVEGMNDRVKLKIEEMRKLKEIEESPEFTPEQKEQIKKQVSAEARKEQDKQEWESFKGTEMYTMMFDDLEHLGTKALGALQKKLEDLKGSLSDLPASEVKEIVQQISKIEDIVIEKTNPFKYMRELRDELKGMKSEEDYQIDLVNAQSAQEGAQKAIDAINTVKNAQLEHGESALELVDEETLRLYNELTAEAARQGKTIEEILKDKEAVVKKSKEEAAAAAKGINVHQRAKKALEQQANTWSEYESKASEAFAVTKELMTTLGADTDGVAMSLVESGESLVMLTFQAIQFGIQMQIAGYQANMALGVIGWILIAVQAIVTLLAAIFSAKDKSLQKEIEGHLNEVEKLKEDYEELDALMEEAWNTADIAHYNAEMKETMNLAIAAQKAAIKAQESRKGANKEGSDVYDELQDMKKELADMENTLAESLEESFSKVTDGILDEVLDAAKDFTDAWYDAFKETGDGLSGLEENFEEMFMNLAKNQAAMQITGAFTERWKEALKDYINDEDTKLTREDAAAWAKEVRDSFPELNAALEAFLGTISEGLSGKSGRLSELQKGIQGITEETAQVLEALLNSMRLYVADTNNEIKSQTTYIKKMWTMMDNAVSGSRPFYVQMKTI
jgi:hypothetical protein